VCTIYLISKNPFSPLIPNHWSAMFFRCARTYYTRRFFCIDSLYNTTSTEIQKNEKKKKKNKIRMKREKKNVSLWMLNGILDIFYFSLFLACPFFLSRFSLHPTSMTWFSSVALEIARVVVGALARVRGRKELWLSFFKKRKFSCPL
jgi:hypothetical protein